MMDTIKARLSGRKRWFAGLAPRMIRQIQDRLETWRSTRRLLAFDDAMLKDIGISRGDVERVVRHGRPSGHRHFPE